MWRWIAAATGLALAVRLHGLGADSLWGDEAFTWQMTTYAWPLVLTAEGSVNFPAYYILAKASVALLGDGEAALRLPVALLMAAAVPFIALLARRIAGPVAAVVAAFVAALSPTLIHYGQEARAYALLVLASAATLVAFARTIDMGGDAARPRAKDIALLGGVGALLLYAHPYGILEMAGLGLVVIARWIAERRWPRAAFLGLAIAGAAFAPFLPGLFHRAQDVAETPWLPPTSPAGAVQVPGMLLQWGGGDLVTGLFGALVVLACARLPRPWRRLALALALLCWIAPAVWSRFGTSVFHQRYALGLAPLAIAAIGGLVAGAAARRRRSGLLAGGAVLGLLALAALHYVATRPHRPDWRTAFAELKRAREEGATPVLVSKGTTSVAAYYFREEAVLVGVSPKGKTYERLEPLPPGRIAVVASPNQRDAVLEAAKGRAIVREMPRTRREDRLFLVIE